MLHVGPPEYHGRPGAAFACVNGPPEEADALHVGNAEGKGCARPVSTTVRAASKLVTSNRMPPLLEAAGCFTDAQVKL